MFRLRVKQPELGVNPGAHPGLSLPTHQGLADRPRRIILVEHDLHNTEPGLHLRLLVLLLAEGSEKLRVKSGQFRRRERPRR